MAGKSGRDEALQKVANVVLSKTQSNSKLNDDDDDNLDIFSDKEKLLLQK